MSRLWCPKVEAIHGCKRKAHWIQKGDAMNSSLASFRFSGPGFITIILLWGLIGFFPVTQAADAPAPLTTVEELKGETSDAGKVEERGLPRSPMPQRMLPGGRILGPGGTFSALTKAECTGLGCKAVDDTTCKDVGGLRQRCVCSGRTTGVCIDEVK
jgi:hypothetical protein